MTDAAGDGTNAPGLGRRLLAEFLGTGLLVCIVVGSGIAAQRLSPGDVGLQLLENSLATASGLAVLILLFGPVSGAHLNPVVTLAEWLLERRSGSAGGSAAAYLAAQVTGGIGGALLADSMFGVGAGLSTKHRVGAGHLIGEVVATAVLLLVIFGPARSGRSHLVAPAVGGYLGAAYWFTSSTSFANPAVTIGRVFTDTFAGIAPASTPAFVLAQLAGLAVALPLILVLFPHPATAAEPEAGRRTEAVTA